ncbi:MAG TPA: hypothetical protein VN665_00250 [Candidatus Paceibacterota bacterium]|nr:hypothetical protein [Candidatus Paceibacterota bacterium]
MKRHKKLQWYWPQLIGLLFLSGSLLYLLATHRGTPTANTLAYYVGAEQLDPIFAIEGTDPAKLTNAVAAFLSQKNDLVAEYGKGQSASLEASIYPAAFLQDLPNLEAARQTLLTSPTVAHAVSYHDLLERTITDYANNANALANSFTRISAGLPTLGYIEGNSSSVAFAATLRTVAAQALQQKQKEDARFACFQNSSTNCTPLSTLAQARDEALTAPPTLPAPTASTYKVDALTRQLLPLFANFATSSKTIFAIPSDCYPQPYAFEHEYYIAPYQGGTARKLDYINDAYFQDITAQEQNHHTSYTAALLQGGATITYESIANQYECADSGFDVMQAGSLQGALEAIGQKTTTTAEEQKLLALPVVQKADLAPYVQSQALLNTPEANDIVERYIEGSADFDQMVLGTHNDNRFLQVWDSGQSAVSFNFLLTARNFASTLFLMGNPTFVPQKVSLFSQNVANPLSKVFMREYVNDVSKQYTDAQILSQIKKAIQIQVQVGLRGQ